jgi:hypothetical protein
MRFLCSHSSSCSSGSGLVRRGIRVPTPRLSSQVFLKRIVATPGARLSIRQGRPVVNGSIALADVIQPCRHFVSCNMKRAIIGKVVDEGEATGADRLS